MMRLLLLVAAALVAASCANSTSAPASSGCPHGASWHHKVNGVDTVDYCGPARAVTRFAGKTWTFKNGSCLRVSDRFVVNIGRAGVYERQPPKTHSFGVIVFNPRNGGNARKDSSAALTLGQKGYFVNISAMTLRSHMSRGSFSGRLFSGKGDLPYDGARISAKFSCNGGV